MKIENGGNVGSFVIWKKQELQKMDELYGNWSK